MLNASLRPVEVRVHTSDFRVYGILHMRPGVGTAWMLNAEDRPHLPITRVAMYRPGVPHPPVHDELVYETHFAAVPKASVVWMAGGAPEGGQEGMGRVPRQVYLVYPTHVLTGHFLMRGEVRLSDHIAAAMAGKPFVTLFDARVLGFGPRGQTFDQLPVLQAHEFVTVNLRAVGGIFDERGGDPAKAYALED